MSGESRIPQWFDRKFTHQTTPDMFPNVLCRLRGAPARLDELVRSLDKTVLIEGGEGWSIQENAGHLIDLEPLWDARLSDFLAGVEILTEADLTNRKTHLADHNSADAGELLQGFRESRCAFLARCKDLVEKDFARTSLHPRLQAPMRLIDFLTFIAEHDDHHLARIQELSETATGGGESPCDSGREPRSGRVEQIHLSAGKGQAISAVDEVWAVAGQGLQGDRYHRDDGTVVKAKRQVTLIEAEALEAVERDYGVQLGEGETRRNLITRGVALNHLVGQDFSIGEVRVRGHKLCEPCGYLEKLTGREMMKLLRHRGGLRAEILSTGTIRVGDPVRV